MDPLDADEMRVAQTVLRTNGLLSDGRRITLLDVNEPSKADVLSGRAVSRAAFAVIYDATRNATGEAIVDVSTRRLRSWRLVPLVQPALDGVDASLTDSIVRADEGWRAALARRGIHPSSRVTVFAWSAGQFGSEDSAHHRLVRAVTCIRAARENEMARPVEGLIAMVDLSVHRVVRLDDEGTVSVPDVASEREAWRPLAPPTTPEPAMTPWPNATSAGPSPRVDGHAVHWRRWRFRVALRPREGLVLYAVGFDDGTRVRSVMYRASLLRDGRAVWRICGPHRMPSRSGLPRVTIPINRPEDTDSCGGAWQTDHSSAPTSCSGTHSASPTTLGRRTGP